MAKRSKRYIAMQQKITGGSNYSIEEAVAIFKEGGVKFNESLELHVTLGIDPKKSDQLARGSVQFPHGIGKSVVVAAFVGSNQEKEAKDAGADVIGSQDVIDAIKQTGKVTFDVAIATPDMMRAIAPIARILGQKGLMPNPKTGTVGTDVKKMVEELKAGKVNFKNDDGGNVHVLVGKMSFTPVQLRENISAAFDAIKKTRASSVKGEYIKSATLSASMSPGIHIAVI